MHLEKLVTVLKSFDASRMRRLKEFVSSPYFGTPPVGVLLLERLAPLHPEFPEKKMQWQNLGKNGRTLSTLSKQRNAGSLLQKAVELFIAQEEWQKNKSEVTRCLLKGYKELSLDAEFQKGYEKESEALENSAEQNCETFFERHILTELSLTGFNARMQRNAQNDLMPVVKTLEEFYALKKLRYLCEVVNRQRALGIKYEAEDLSHLFKILAPYTNPEFPYVYLFVNVYRMMEETTYGESDVYYRLLKQFIERRSGGMPSQSIREAADYAAGCCLRWNNKGYEEAGNEYLWWIEWKLKNDLLLQNGRLMPVAFRNIISAAQSQNNAARIEEVIKDYGPYLPAEHRQTNLAFAKGLQHYTLKKYKEAIRFFLVAEAGDEVVFNSIIRRWHWMCLYEYDCNDTDALLSHFHSFEKYLQRNQKKLQHVSATFVRFNDYAMKLLRIIDSEVLEQELAALQNEEHFAGKLWLAQQFSAKQKTRTRGVRVEVSVLKPSAKY